MENVNLKVTGMSCGHCVKAIEGSVGKLAGVAHVKVDLQGAQVSVQYNENEVTIDRIKDTIDDQGYDVE